MAHLYQRVWPVSVDIRGILNGTADYEFRVVFVQKSANRDGSAVSGLLIVKTMIGAGADVTVVFGHDGEMVIEYQAAGCDCMIVDHGDWLRPGGVFRSARRLVKERRAGVAISRATKDLRPDLFYVNSLASYAGAIAGHNAGVPVIWHVRELFADADGEAHPPRSGGKWFVRREIARLANATVAVSNVVAQQVLGSSQVNYAEIISNAVPDELLDAPIDRESSRTQFSWLEADFVIGAVGSIRPVKGFDNLIRAVPYIRSILPNVVIAIAGEGDGYDLLALATELDVLDCLRLLGPINPIRSFYDGCDVICVPSRSESFGRVAIEAMSRGVPVVASAVGGMLETIEDGVTGLLVHPESPDQIAKAILKLASDAAYRDKLSCSGQAETRHNFSATTVTSQTEQLIHRVVEALNPNSR